MTFTSKVLAVFFVAMLFVACGPTYVVQNPNQVPTGAAYSYDPGYNPDNVIADAIIASAIVNGVNGYYGTGHVFYPQTMYGGVPGYYVGGVFHTSTQYRTTIVNHYNSDRDAFQRNPQQFAQSHPDLVKKPNYTSNQNAGQGVAQRAPATNSAPAQNAPGKPNYSAGPGTAQRAPATTAAVPQNVAPAGKPAYSSTPGSAQRAPASPSPPLAAKPSYSASPGTAQRSVAVPRPSFSQSSGSVGRRK